MKPKNIGAGILGITTLTMGGIDASVLNETAISRVELVASERVEAKQVGNVVETTLPWKDQAGLKVKYDLGEPTVMERVADKRKKEIITETVTDFEGGFKVDILLNERPTTNVFCYTIEGAENYDFFYQPPLTEQEIAEGASRPPEIEGSYAVYHKTLRNHQLGKENYATGKVMHIPRPQVWSMADVDTKVWADMQYDNGSLCVTVPQDFLDKAKYPVRVDPTFGYTSIGVSEQFAAGDRFRSSPAETPSAGTLTMVSYYLKKQSSNQPSKGVVYQDSDDTLIDTGTEVSITSTSPQWWDSTVTQSITAQSYFAGFGFNGASGNGVYFYFDTVATTTILSQTFTYSTFPSPATPISSTQKISVYATYTASGGSATSTDSGIIWFD